MPRLFEGDGLGAGPLTVPLAWSLLAGATALLVTEAVTAPAADESPWWPVLIGVGTALVAYGVGEVVDAGL